MKLSTRSRYGVRMMYELAVNYGKEPVIIKDIAARQEISDKYLSKLIIPLKGARLVNSARGSHGGYMLARDPSKITIREIIEILEGDLAPVECVNNRSICGRSATCPTRDFWRGLDNTISAFLEGITLDQIARQGNESDAPSYCI